LIDTEIAALLFVVPTIEEVGDLQDLELRVEDGDLAPPQEAAQ
jgi:hypothetical protein